MKNLVNNKDLRLMIAEMIYKSKEGHIPSSFSIVDIINILYEKFLRNKYSNDISKRDIFILSKGHGAAALYATLYKHKLLKLNDINNYSLYNGILGGHPDTLKIKHVDASTGSLGHGFPTAMGIALAQKIKKINYRVFCLLGDGECHEGTIWETAHVANNLGLNNLIAIIDLNDSAKQLMPEDNLYKKFKAFGFETYKCNGNNNESLTKVISEIDFKNNKPKAIIAKTIKGYGVKFLSGHGPWHHKIPNESEMNKIRNILK